VSKRLLIVGASRGLGAVACAYFKGKYEVVTLHFDYLKPDTFFDPDEFDAVLHCQGGGMGLRDPLIRADSFADLFSLNVVSAAAVNSYVLPGMIARRSGAICHVCSIASNEAIGSVGYNTVKAALAAYVRSLGREMAPFGVVVSGIAPGGFKSPQGAMERLEANSPEAYREFVEERLPRKRMGSAEELMPMIELLLSPAGSMMGGCVVPIDAGEGRAYL
jgi:3-oxoacyl-[acyl-carrier protein] reductase